MKGFFKIDFSNHTNMEKMLSVCKDKFAFYDKESDAITFLNSQGKRTISLKGKVLSSLCVTETQIHLILDNRYVCGNLDEGVFRSVDNLPKGKVWNTIFYTQKDNVEGLTFLSHNKESDIYEFFIQDKKGKWMDISPRESNLVQSIPDLDSVLRYFVDNAGKYYYGVFDPVSKTPLWKNVQLPPEIKFSRIAFGKDDIFFTTFDPVTEETCLYKTDVKLLLGDKDGATRLMFKNKAVILDLHSYRDFKVFLTPEYLVLSSDDKLYRHVQIPDLKDDDFLLEMKGLNGDLILRSQKGHIFKAKFENDDNLSAYQVK